jgi:hypothetical protein
MRRCDSPPRGLPLRLEAPARSPPAPGLRPARASSFSPCRFEARYRCRCRDRHLVGDRVAAAAAVPQRGGERAEACANVADGPSRGVVAGKASSHNVPAAGETVHADRAPTWPMLAAAQSRELVLARDSPRAGCRRGAPRSRPRDDGIWPGPWDPVSEAAVLQVRAVGCGANNVRRARAAVPSGAS